MRRGLSAAQVKARITDLAVATTGSIFIYCWARYGICHSTNPIRGLLMQVWEILYLIKRWTLLSCLTAARKAT
jgi:hypothetical protein